MTETVPIKKLTWQSSGVHHWSEASATPAHVKPWLLLPTEICKKSDINPEAEALGLSVNLSEQSESLLNLQLTPVHVNAMQFSPHSDVLTHIA